MTDVVIPSVQGNSNAFVIAQLIRYGANTDGWIQESASALLADNDSRLDQTAVPLNAFNESHSGTSFDVTIDTGEGFVGGAWLARDTATTVTLSSGTANQTVYVGWDYDSTETVKIGKSGAFTSEDPKIAIWEFDTDSSGVTSSTDERPLGPSSSLGQVTTDAGSQFARFLMTAISSTASGSPGNSAGETWRAPGNASDLLMTVSADGKMNIAWNCYFDGTDWRYIVGSEPAYRVQFGGGVSLHAQSGGTADNIVNFHSLTIDDLGDLYSDSVKIYDHSSDSVPQARQGGPSSSLTSYPLPAGDISDGSGSSLDADLVDGYHASDLQGGQWTTIQTYSQTDTTLNFGFDSGTLTTTYDLYKVQAVFVNQTSANNEFQPRLQNDGTSSYDTRGHEPSSDVVQYVDDTAWQNVAKIDAHEVGQVEALIRGGGLVSTTTNTKEWPTISFESAANPSLPQAEFGQLTNSYATVDSIQFDTKYDATGKLKLLGMNL